MVCRARRRNTCRWTHVPFTVTLFLWLQTVHVAYALLTNVTIQGDDPSIRYHPAEAWKWSWDEAPLVASSFEGTGKKVAGRGEHDPPYPGVEYDRRADGERGTDTLSDPNPSVVAHPLPAAQSNGILQSKVRRWPSFHYSHPSFTHGRRSSLLLRPHRVHSRRTPSIKNDYESKSNLAACTASRAIF
ncbi:hypothetical protein NMY22_g11162 [Coprinellus aureogranulatus]|nr:hypothetical protein NMY22_g11162 [Coprinellus aureogranulatus]